MIIHEDGIKFNTKKIIVFYQYINDLLNKNEIYGKFRNINLKNKELLIHYGLCSCSKNANQISYTDYYRKIRVFKKIGLIVAKSEANYFKEITETYRVNKILFIVTLILFLVINNLTSHEIREAKKSRLDRRIVTLASKLISSIYKKRIFVYENGEHRIFNKIINRFYLCCHILINTHKEINFDNFLDGEILKYTPITIFFHYEIFNCNNFFYLLERLVNDDSLSVRKKRVDVKYRLYYEMYKVIYESEYVRLSDIETDKGNTHIVDILHTLSINWFTDRTPEEKHEKIYSQSNSIEVNNCSRWDYENNHLHKAFLNFNHLQLHDLILPVSQITILQKEENLETVKEEFKKYVIDRSRLIRYALEIFENLKYDTDIYKLPINIKTTKGANAYGIYNYSFRPTGRMSNYLCSFEKYDVSKSQPNYREKHLSKLGFDCQYDIKGTVFSIVRAINKRKKLDLEYDIKELLARENIIASICGVERLLRKKDFKGLLYYMFFASSKNETWNDYNNRYLAKIYSKKSQKEFDYLDDELEKIFANVPDFDEQTFNRLYDIVQDSTGGTIEFRNNIFFIETCIEAKTIIRLKKLGIQVKNVYDCFFWKSSQMDEDFLKSIIIDEASDVFRAYREFKLEYESYKAMAKYKPIKLWE
jgi:hypothetical protein